MATRDLTAIAFFAALTAVCAQVSVTLPGLSGVPFTMQVFAVLAAGAVLGARRGMLSQIVYLLLGAAGLPVFAGWHGGAPILVGPTAGYLWAFPLAALIVGWCADAAARVGSPGVARWGVYAGMVAGLAVIYGLGAAGLVASRAVRTLTRAIQVGVLPFVWADLIKAYLAAVIAARVRAAIAPAPLLSKPGR